AGRTPGRARLPPPPSSSSGAWGRRKLEPRAPPPASPWGPRRSRASSPRPRPRPRPGACPAPSPPPCLQWRPEPGRGRGRGRRGWVGNAPRPRRKRRFLVPSGANSDTRSRPIVKRNEVATGPAASVLCPTVPTPRPAVPPPPPLPPPQVSGLLSAPARLLLPPRFKSPPGPAAAPLPASRRGTMPRTLGPLAALLALLLLGFFPPPAFGQNATVKAGVCPERPAADNCTEDCLSDGDCPDTSKCCRAGCSSQCLIPNDKPGTCPEVKSGIPLLGLCHDQCQVDSECLGQQKCCKNGCGKVSCVTPDF
uniref:WAP four-disulfide core domain protein 2 n=2 Tax=Ornithorhynchus anatinus TaxID=9258 RepID=F7FWP7_ORNAN